jgi:hypothetical protein
MEAGGRREEMECPSCRNDTNTALVRTEHIYPDLVPGVPTFWRFMAPTLARYVTAAVGGIAVTFSLLGIASSARASAIVSVSVGVTAVLSAYIFVKCLRGLRHHHVRRQFRCTGCGLEWARPDELAG